MISSDYRIYTLYTKVTKNLCTLNRFGNTEQIGNTIDLVNKRNSDTLPWGFDWSAGMGKPEKGKTQVDFDGDWIVILASKTKIRFKV